MRVDEDTVWFDADGTRSGFQLHVAVTDAVTDAVKDSVKDSMTDAVSDAVTETHSHCIPRTRAHVLPSVVQHD